MHQEVIKKIRKLRREKGIEPQDMADKLNISISTYKRLESVNTITWAKYLQEILMALETTVEDFFDGIGNNIVVNNKKGSFGGNIHVENLFAENKDKTKKIEQLYEERLKDSEKLNIEKDRLIVELKAILDLKQQIIASIHNLK